MFIVIYLFIYVLWTFLNLPKQILFQILFKQLNCLCSWCFHIISAEIMKQHHHDWKTSFVWTKFWMTELNALSKESFIQYNDSTFTNCSISMNLSLEFYYLQIVYLSLTANFDQICCLSVYLLSPFHQFSYCKIWSYNAKKKNV